MAEFSIAEITARMFADAVKNQLREDDDYINPADGLLYCGKCKTPKQQKAHITTKNGVELPIVSPILCACEARKRAEEETRRKEEADMLLVSALRKKSLMDDKFRGQTFDSFKVTPQNEYVYKLCKRYAENFDDMAKKNQGLLLYGDVGTGKTFAASCIANYLLEHRRPVVMTSFAKILNEFSANNEEIMLGQLNRARLLILDDLGAERSTEWALEKVYNIIDGRYRAGLPLILTTNLKWRVMSEATDDRYRRIYDRIFEMCYPLKFEGQSFRKQEASQRWEKMKAFLEGDNNGKA